MLVDDDGMLEVESGRTGSRIVSMQGILLQRLREETGERLLDV